MVLSRRLLVALIGASIVVLASCAHSDPQSSSSSSQAPGMGIGADTVDAAAAVETLSIAPPPDSGTLAVETAPTAAAAPTTAADPSLDPALVACHADSDCTAVRKNACCNHGDLEAVAASKVDAYRASFTCKTPHLACPKFLRRDTRVAKCDSSAGRCVLVSP